MLVALLSETEAWWDNWAAAATLLGDSLLGVGLPVTGAFACWLGGTDARQGTKWLSATAARPPLQRVMTQAAPAVLWPLGGYLLVIAVLGLIIPVSAYFGSVPFDTVTSDVALQTMTACLGYALGRAVSLRFTAPLFGLLIAVAGAGLSPVSAAVPQSYSGRNVPGLDELYSVTLPQWLPWLWSAVFLILAATALTVCARRWSLAILCLLAVVPAAIWLVSSQERGRSHQLAADEMAAHFPSSSNGPYGSIPFFYRSAPDPVPLECSGSPHVCTAADTQIRVDMEPTLMKAMAGRLDGVRGAPTHYVLTRSIPHGHNDTAPESASGRDGDQRWWTVAMPDTGSELHLGAPLQRAVQAALLGAVIAEGAETECSQRTVATVAAWLVPPRYRKDAGISAADTAPLDELPEARRTAWLSNYFSGSPCKPLPEPSHRSKATP